jgi:hypothetical protein
MAFGTSCLLSRVLAEHRFASGTLHLNIFFVVRKLEAKQLWVDHFHESPVLMPFRTLLAMHLKLAINDNERSPRAYYIRPAEAC